MSAPPLIAEAGTDVAALVLLDPHAQPETFDADLRRDAKRTLAQMQADGRGFWFETGADGGYLAHVYLGTQLPSGLEPVLHERVEMPTFAVRSGRLLFAGAEYAHGRDDARLRKYPAMGTFIDVPPGDYRLLAWRTEWPDDVDEQVGLRIGRTAQSWDIVRVVAGVVVVLATLRAILLARAGSLAEAAVAATIAAVHVLAIRAVGRLPQVARRAVVAREIERERPSVVFQRLATDTRG